MTDDTLMDQMADVALGAARDASAAEVMVTRETSAVTRFADSEIHQNTTKNQWQVAVRAVLDDGRAGVASIVSDDPDDAALVARRAVALARLALADPGFAGVASAADAEPGWWDDATANADADARAAVAGRVVREVGELSAAGSVATRAKEQIVRTSSGADMRGHQTAAQITLVLTGPQSTGHAETGSHALAELDPEDAARRAVAKVEAGRDPQPVDTGEWPVVLEPSAVAALAQYFGWLGFGAKMVDEGRSFASGRLGEAVLDPKITFVDDPSDRQGRGFPFDAEGTPTQRVEMVRDGVLTGIVHDRRSAARTGTTSTGHALPPPNRWGPIPLNAFFLPGSGGSVDDLVSRMERGLLVTRFHYVNIVAPKETLLTGMTRDGTFLIENGKVARPVHNLRFTQSIVDALTEVDAVGSQTGYGTELLDSGTHVPALALPRFSFTGLTDFG